MYLYGEVCVPNWIIWIVFVILSLLGYTTYKQSIFRRMGVRGPKPTPFLGHIRTMSREGLFEFERRLMREYGQIYGTFYGNVPSLVVNDPDIIKEVCVKQFSKFINRPELASVPTRWYSSVTHARGVHWKYLRFSIGPTFSSGKVKNMVPILDKCLADFIDVLNEKIDTAADNVIEIYQVFAALTMDIICSTSFGIEVNFQKNSGDVFVKHASKVLDSSFYNPIILLNFMFPDIKKFIPFRNSDYADNEAMDFLTQTVKGAMQERRKNKSYEFHDLLKLMMNSQSAKQTSIPELETEHEYTTFEMFKSKGLVDDEIIMNGIMFLAAGYETTSILLSWVAYCLATNPDCQEKLLKEIDTEIGRNGCHESYDKVLKLEYLEKVLSETLRLYSPGVRIHREAACDVTIKGLKIPKGIDVVINSALHMNPKYWPSPDKFDPERFSRDRKSDIVPYSYIPFGVGPRNCVGMKLALVEVKLSIVKMLQHVRLEKSPKCQTPPKMATGNFIKPVDGMWLRLARR